MNPQLERIEIQPLVLDDDNFAVKNTLIGQGQSYRIKQLGEIAVERSLVTALQINVIAIAKHNRAKAIPLRLDDPAVPWRENSNTLRQHRLNRRVDRQFHWRARDSFKAEKAGRIALGHQIDLGLAETR